MLDRSVVEQVLQCGARICVVGDIILDRYTWGNATRVSPEACHPHEKSVRFESLNW